MGEQPGLYVRNVVVDEKAGSATFVVLLGGPNGVASDSEVTVNYAVAGGSATAGSDFNGNFDPLSGQLVFGPGEVVKTVTVAITDDAVAEPVERFTLKLSNAVNARHRRRPGRGADRRQRQADLRGTRRCRWPTGSSARAPAMSTWWSL